MRILILTLLVLTVAVAVALARPKTCKGDDCNFGHRCYTTSQCKCGLVCRGTHGEGEHDPFAQKACQF